MPRRETPLALGDEPLLLFAADLRALREQAGTPPYRQLALRAHCSAASLSVAAGGRRLPSLAVTLAYVQACGGDVRRWQQRWQLLAADQAAESAARRRVRDLGREPYPGAAAFEVADAARFFGREALVDRLAALVAERRLVVVSGPSGSGKSSLVRAGLLARLAEASRATALLTPGERPMPAYRQARARLARRAAELADTDPVLVVDQAEELATRCRDAAERRRFLAALATAVQGECRIVLVIRADQERLLGAQPELAGGARLPVERPAPQELRRMIGEPALRAGCTVEGALLAVLISAAAQQPGALPLLSAALLETWRRRSGNALTLAGFEATGGFEGALARLAEELYGELTAEDRERARSVFLRLSWRAPADGVERAEFADVGVPELLERLAAARLVVLGQDTVELAHHGLPAAWPRLRGWLADGRRRVEEDRRLTEAARRWLAAAQDPELLYRGGRLELALRQVRRSELLPGTVERAFLQAATRAAAAERRRARRQSLAVATLAAAGGVLLTLAGGRRVRRS